mgnify:CR=1 FL=1
MRDSEFTFLGQSAEKITAVIGLILLIWGIFVSIISDSQSFTSYIPSLLGLLLVLCALLAIFFENKKSLFMHIAVIFGLITFLGGADVFRSITSDTFLAKSLWADLSKILLLVCGGFHTYVCVQSFRFVRKNRDNPYS